MKQATLIRNLKLFNAKERDHLMRAAYLGVGTSKYQETTQFLSDDFDRKLRSHLNGLGLDPSKEHCCVFAAMDYHLDWLFAALWMTANHSGWNESPKKDICLPLAAAPEPRPGINPLHTDFRPITGTQEDIDLLVVYSDGKNLAILFVEAKGSAAFSRVQLARKLIRLYGIIAHDEISRNAEFGDFPTRCRLVLAAPTEPDLKDSKKQSYESWLSFAKDLPEKRSAEFTFMKKALDEIKGPFGDGTPFIEIEGFPKTLFSVERQRETKSKEGAYTHCKLKLR